MEKNSANTEKAFYDLYHEFKNMVYNVSLSYLQIVEDAEEITQDVFIEVHRSLKNFKGDSEMKTWIYRITVNKSLDFVRFKNRKKRFAFLTSLFHPDSEKLNIQPIEFIHPGVTLENKETSAILFKAINNLPENQKTAFLLSKTEGLSNIEISKIMQLSVGAIESLLSRAKENLKKKLITYYKS